METKIKIYIGLFIIILIGSFIAAYNHAISENGRLTQEKANLEQSLKDSEANLALFQKVASYNSGIISKTEKQKAVLNTYALKIANELEVLKNENTEIKKWANITIPGILADRLFKFAHNENKTKSDTDPSGAITTYRGTGIKILNQATYQFAIDNLTALRQCNEDKLGVLSAYNKGLELTAE